MAGPINTTPTGVQDSLGVRAIGRIPANSRVITPTGAVGVVFDVVLFPGTPDTKTTVIGQWILPNQRTRANGMPTIGSSSVGIAYAIVTLPAPTLVPNGTIRVVQGNPRTKGF